MWHIINQSLILASNISVGTIYAALQRREPIAMFPALFLVLTVLGIAACEISAEKDPIRRQERRRRRAKDTHRTIVRF